MKEVLRQCWREIKEDVGKPFLNTFGLIGVLLSIMGVLFILFKS